MSAEASRSMNPWPGRVLTALPVVALAGSSFGKLTSAPPLVEMMVSKLGLPADLIPKLGALELLCVLLYAVPRTSALGALLLTAYLGGAVSVHVRVGDNFAAPIVLGVLVWAGLYFRDERVRALLPLRK